LHAHTHTPTHTLSIVAHTHTRTHTRNRRFPPIFNINVNCNTPGVAAAPTAATLVVALAERRSIVFEPGVTKTLFDAQVK
jgi:hypothetical protein